MKKPITLKDYDLVKVVSFYKKVPKLRLVALIVSRELS